ncbi:hypothetical protein [Streptomyces sp. CB02009]|uniref:hypothetical protein n=1 Tax=Streptomyces sp. CB02009 TaxID=1703938 RepID=UPI000A6BC783|nr:hypothetical protein [Streptomyces sp. CB02009]
MRHLTLALQPHHPADATDRELQRATADALGEVYFRGGGHRVHDLEVELTYIKCIQFDL